MSQSAVIVKIRDPGNRTYRDEPVFTKAKSDWEYAIMSENAYRDHWTKEKPVANPQESLVAVPFEQTDAKCNVDSNESIPLTGWSRWRDFPLEDPELFTSADRQQLFFEVWQKEIPGKLLPSYLEELCPANGKPG